MPSATLAFVTAGFDAAVHADVEQQVFVRMVVQLHLAGPERGRSAVGKRGAQGAVEIKTCAGDTRIGFNPVIVRVHVRGDSSMITLFFNQDRGSRR